MASASDMVDRAQRATGDQILTAGRFTVPRPPHTGIVVAVIPSRVYLLRRPSPGDGPDERLALVHTFDRRRVAATIHTRLGSRTLTLEDTWTSERFDLVGERSPDADVTATMHTLSAIHELAS